MKIDEQSDKPIKPDKITTTQKTTDIAHDQNEKPKETENEKEMNAKDIKPILSSKPANVEYFRFERLITIWNTIKTIFTINGHDFFDDDEFIFEEKQVTSRPQRNLLSYDNQVSYQNRRLLSTDNSPKKYYKPKGADNKQIVGIEKQSITRKGSKSSGKQRTPVDRHLHEPIVAMRRVNEVPKNKKVGWEYRYRVSRYLGEQSKSDVKYDNEQNDGVEGSRAEDKPKVGWEHRYRISRYLNDVVGQKTGANVAAAVQKKCDGNPNALHFGSYLIDKNKVGKIGWQYRYRVTKKLGALLDESKMKKQSKKSRTGEVPLEIVDFLDDPNIPYCDQILDTNEHVTTPVQSDHENAKHENKPKVGWQYRYRLSRMMESQKNNELPQAKTITRNQDEEKGAPPKPKVGWEHRYRVHKLNVKKQQAEPVEQQVDSVSENLNTHKIGFEYRYRLQRKLDAQSQHHPKKTDKKKANDVEVEVEKKKAKIEVKTDVNSLIEKLIPYVPKFAINIFCLHSDSYATICQKNDKNVEKDLSNKKGDKTKPESSAIRTQKTTVQEVKDRAVVLGVEKNRLAKGKMHIAQVMTVDGKKPERKQEHKKEANNKCQCDKEHEDEPRTKDKKKQQSQMHTQANKNPVLKKSKSSAVDNQKEQEQTPTKGKSNSINMPNSLTMPIKDEKIDADSKPVHTIKDEDDEGIKITDDEDEAGVNPPQASEQTNSNDDDDDDDDDQEASERSEAIEVGLFESLKSAIKNAPALFDIETNEQQAGDQPALDQKRTKRRSVNQRTDKKVNN
jgi:hypothetical protein